MNIYNFINDDCMYTYVSDSGEIVFQSKEDNRLIVMNRRVKNNYTYSGVVKIGLMLTQICNLKCQYCYAGEGEYHSPGMMTTDVAIKCIKENLQEKKAIEVVFFGGEPLINYEVIKNVVEYYYKKGENISFSVTTNGTLITEEIEKFLIQYNINVLVSLDGGFRDNYNRIYKNGTPVYLDVIKNTSLIRKKLRVGVRATLMPDRLDLVDRAKHILEQGFSYFTYEPAFEYFDDEGIENLLVKCKEYFYYLYDEIKNGHFEYVRKNRSFYKMLEKVHYSKKRDRYCNAGKSIAAYDIQGEKSPCHRFVELQNIYQKKISMDDVYSELKSRNKAKCEMCFAYNFCNMGCPYNAYSGKMNMELYCKFIKGILNNLLELYVKLGQKEKENLFSRREYEK